MADVALHRADLGVAGAVAVLAPGLGQRGDLDGIAQVRGGAVCFDVAERVGGNTRVVQRHADHLGLAAHRGRGVADLVAAVVVERAAADHGIDGVAVAFGVGAALQHQAGDAAAADHAAAFGVEDAHAAVLREDAAVDPGIAGLQRRHHARAADDGGVAFAREERTAGEMQQHAAGGAGGLGGDRRAAQVELVADVGCGVVLVVAEGDVHLRKLRARHRIAGEVVAEVAVAGDAAIGADAAGHVRRVVAGVLQRGPGAFEQQALLRVHECCFARTDAEELVVEAVGVGERGVAAHVAGIAARVGRHTCGVQLVLADRHDGLDAVAQVVPELLDALRTRQARGHADDHDLVAGHRRRVTGSSGGLARADRGSGRRAERRGDRFRMARTQATRIAADAAGGEEIHHQRLHAQALAQAADALDCLERAAAEFEEGVVDADRRDFQQLGPEGREGFLQRLGRRGVGDRQWRALGGRRGQGAAVDLAADGQR